MSRILVGVDVCKAFLDAHARPADTQQRFDNNPAGIEQLVAWVRARAPERVVFESTGPYQKAAVGALLAAGLPAVEYVVSASDAFSRANVGRSSAEAAAHIDDRNDFHGDKL